jgi:hypothetical protein
VIPYVFIAASGVFIILMAIFAIATEWADDAIEDALDDLHDTIEGDQ